MREWVRLVGAQCRVTVNSGDSATFARKKPLRFDPWQASYRLYGRNSECPA